MHYTQHYHVKLWLWRGRHIPPLLSWLPLPLLLSNIKELGDSSQDVRVLKVMVGIYRKQSHNLL